MKSLNLGSAIAAAWEESVVVGNRRPFDSDFLLDALTGSRRKPGAVTAKMRARWKREAAAHKREQAKAMAKFRGTVISTEGDPYDPVLVFEDGRRLKLTEYQW